MELKLCTYATVTTLGDFGPWISKVVLDLPCTVRANDIDTNTFNIYVERHERSGEVLMRKERRRRPCRALRGLHRHSRRISVRRERT